MKAFRFSIFLLLLINTPRVRNHDPADTIKDDDIAHTETHNAVDAESVDKPEIKKFEDITKSPGDEREYRGLILPNQLRVLLVSDPETDKAAAAMTVCVGSMHDPDNLPGLAHFLEHMLFMGSEAHPQEDHFRKFVHDHAGAHNGSTYEDKQTFYWDIFSDHLATALDIMAQFFLNPLMDQSVVDREVNAINSEYVMNLPRDTWRIDALLKSLSKVGHPHRRFQNGNFESLDTNPKLGKISVRDELLKLHSTWYSSNIMYLAVLGKESLDDLKKLVVSLFEKVENKNVQKLEYAEHPWGPEQLKRKIFAVPIANTRYLTLRFPAPKVSNHYKTAPLKYIFALIGHEGPGSLFHELKERNWCEELTSGYETIPGFTFLYIKIFLTKDALDYIDEIVKLIFQYVYFLKTEGVQEWFFDEIKRLRETAFEFKDKESPIDLVTSLSSAIIDYPFKDVLPNGYLLDRWNSSLIHDFLRHFRPDNMNILVVSKSFEGTTNLVEPWYNTKYKCETIPDNLINGMWKITEPFKKFHLPSPNEYIVDNFDLYPTLNLNDSRHPRVIHESSISQIWFQKDDEFKLPKLYIQFNLYSPITCLSPNNDNLTDIFVELFKDEFTTHAYAATLAGFQWEIDSVHCGINIDLSGYNQKLPVLLKKLVSEMVAFKFNSKKFEVAKETLIRNLENFEARQPHTHADYYISYLLNSNYSKNEFLGTAKILQADDMGKFMKRIFSRVFVQGLIYGNCDDQVAQGISYIIDDTFGPASVVLSQELAFQRGFEMEDGSNLIYVVRHEYHTSSCYYGYFQIGTDELLPKVVIADLFVETVQEKCFDVLRTEEQLGYVVDCGLNREDGVVAFVVVIQSEEHPAYVNSRLEAFLLDLQESFDDMTDREFETHKASLKDIYSEKMVNQEGKSSHYWSEISTRRYLFDKSDAIIALNSLQKEDMLRFFTDYIHKCSSKRRKSAIYVISELTDPVTPIDVLEEGIEVQDVIAFRNSVNLFPEASPYIEITPLGTKFEYT